MLMKTVATTQPSVIVIISAIPIPLVARAACSPPKAAAFPLPLALAQIKLPGVLIHTEDPHIILPVVSHSLISIILLFFKLFI